MNYQPGAIGTKLPSWTEDDTAAVKRLWDDGASGDDIGKALGRSRSAILGLIHRKGWQRRAGGHRVVNVKMDLPIKRGPKPPPRPTVADRVKLPIAARAPIIPEPPALFKTLVALADNDCRYPVNEGGPYLFCGQPGADQSRYCPHHKSITTRIVSVEGA